MSNYTAPVDEIASFRLPSMISAFVASISGAHQASPGWYGTACRTRSRIAPVIAPSFRSGSSLRRKSSALAAVYTSTASTCAQLAKSAADAGRPSWHWRCGPPARQKWAGCGLVQLARVWFQAPARQPCTAASSRVQPGRFRAVHQHGRQPAVELAVGQAVHAAR